MRVVILGCGRLGMRVAQKLVKEPGNKVVLLDKSMNSLNRLGRDFPAELMQGDGVNTEIYEPVMSVKTDVFLALTSNDNTNIMAAEIAKEKYKVEKVIARVDDPIRAKAFEELGIETFCPTVLSEKRIARMITPPKAGDDKGE